MASIVRKLCVLVFLCLALSGCQEVILHQLDELQANKIRVVLAKHGIEATKERNGELWNVSVAANDVPKALTYLDNERVLQRGIRRNQTQSSGFLQSRREKEYAMERNLSWSIERTLEAIPYIREARVHLRMAEGEIPLFEKQRSKSASVLVVASGKQNLSYIKKLVSGASGIDANEVEVIVVRARQEPSVVETRPIPLDEVSAPNEYVVLLKKNRHLALIPLPFILILIIKVARRRNVRLAHDSRLLAQ